MTGVLERAGLRVSVVICAYTEDRWSEILAAVESVHGQTLPAHECLLVVDHNPELACRARARLTGCLVVESTGPPGLSGARNSGVELAGGDVVAFLDDDAVAAPDWLERLSTAYGDENVVAVGGLVSPAWVQPRPGWFPAEFDWVIGCSHSGMPPRTSPVRNLIGANMSFRRDLLVELGGFSHGLGRHGSNAAGCEETELCIRAGAARQGAIVVYEPRARVDHRVPPARGTWRYFMRRCFGEGRSKALVAALAGTASGLSAERSYVHSTLPRGVWRCIGELLRGRPVAALRAVAVVAGLSAAVAGYLTAGRPPRPGGGEEDREGAGGTEMTDERPRRPARTATLRFNTSKAAEARRGPRWVDGSSAFEAGAGAAAPFGTTASLRTSVGTARLRPAVRRAAAGRRPLPEGAVPQRAGARLAAVLPFAGPVAALALWVVVLESRVVLARMTDFGLVSVLPGAYWAALAVLTVSFVMLVRHREASAVALAAHVAVLLAVLHATPAVLYGTLRYEWAWKIVTVTDFVAGHHGVSLAQADPSMVAYQDWPGFFSLNALFTTATGWATPLSYAAWAPLVNEALYAFPLMLIFRSLSADRRIQWTALWIFYLGNWIGQDYLSPQGFAFFLYLVVVAVVLSRMLRPAGEGRFGAGARRSLEKRCGGRAGGVRAGAVVVVLCTVAIAVSHQLTPFMVFGAFAVLAIFRRLSQRWLVAFAGVVAVGWIAIGARTFVSENLPVFYDALGHILQNAAISKYNAGQASADQLLVGDADRLLTLALILLAAAGVLRCLRSGRWRSMLPAALLLVMPAGAVFGNNYGGELLFRVYLFELPFLAFFSAVFLAERGGAVRARARLSTLRSRAAARRARRPRNAPGWLDAARGLAFAALLAGFVVSYYGKEKSNYFPPAEVHAIDQLYSVAPHGSMIISAAGNLPWPLHDYQDYVNYLFTTDTKATVRSIEQHPVTVLSRDLAGGRQKRYLVFATSDAAIVNMTGAMPRGDYGRIERAVLASPLFHVLIHNSDVVVLTLATTR